MKCLKDSANALEDTRAQIQVGLMYLKGEGVTSPNATTAFKWIEKAALNYNVEAMFILGQMYRSGCGCEKDAASAFRFLESAARKGHRGAQILLGNMYIKGEGIRTNRAMADRWYSVADGKTPLSEML